MIYKYKLSPRPPRLKLNRERETAEGVLLSGFVRGQRASDWEEMFARVFNDYKLEFSFQVPVYIGLPGQESLVDFVVMDIYPLEIDHAFTHKSASQRAKDKVRDALIDERMKQYGWQPIYRAPVDGEADYDTAEQIAKDVFYADT